MPPYKVLFLCDDCVASAPVLEALRIGGFRLRIAHSFHQVSAHRGERCRCRRHLEPASRQRVDCEIEAACRRSRPRRSSMQRTRASDEHAASG